MARYNMIYSNTATTVPRVHTSYQYTAYRLSLESDRERLGERLLECDLLCERLRGERDLEQQGNTLNCIAYNIIKLSSSHISSDTPIASFLLTSHNI